MKNSRSVNRIIPNQIFPTILANFVIKLPDIRKWPLFSQNFVCEEIVVSVRLENCQAFILRCLLAIFLSENLRFQIYHEEKHTYRSLLPGFWVKVEILHYKNNERIRQAKFSRIYKDVEGKGSVQTIVGGYCNGVDEHSGLGRAWKYIWERMKRFLII